MSSTGQGVSSTSSSGSNVGLIIDALADYTKITGIDLSKNPFAAWLEQAASPEAVLELFQERVHAFKESRNGNKRLTSTLNAAVRVLHTLSGILGEEVGTVSHTCHLVSLLT
jgi:hypothetical protein